MLPTWLFEADVFGSTVEPLKAEIRKQGMRCVVTRQDLLVRGLGDVLGSDRIDAGKQLWELQFDSIQNVIKHNEARLAETTDAEIRKLCQECITANEGLASILSTTRVPLPTRPFRPYIER